MKTLITALRQVYRQLNRKVYGPLNDKELALMLAVRRVEKQMSLLHRLGTAVYRCEQCAGRLGAGKLPDKLDDAIGELLRRTHPLIDRCGHIDRKRLARAVHRLASAFARYEDAQTAELVRDWHAVLQRLQARAGGRKR